MSAVEARQDHNEINHLFEAHLKPALENIESEQRKIGESSRELEEKFTRISNRIDEVETRINRRGIIGESTEKVQNDEYSMQFERFIRTGAPIERRVHDAFNEDTPNGEQGGYTVIPEWANNIYRRIHELTPMRQLAEVINVSSNLFQIPAESEENFVATWAGEQQARPETNSPDLRMVNIEIKEIYAQPRATQNILEDNAYDLESWLVESLATRFSQRQGEAFILGDGVLEPVGILNPGGGGFGNPLFQTVQTEFTFPPANADAPVPSVNDLIDLQMYIKTGYADNGTWLMHRQFIGQIRKLKNDSGDLIWQPGLIPGQPATILGRPYFEAPDMPSVTQINQEIANANNVNGTPFIAFGDWKRAYTIADRIGFVTKRDDLTDKPYVRFYTRSRVGGNVKDYQAYAVLVIRTP